MTQPEPEHAAASITEAIEADDRAGQLDSTKSLTTVKPKELERPAEDLSSGAVVSSDHL